MNRPGNKSHLLQKQKQKETKNLPAKETLKQLAEDNLGKKPKLTQPIKEPSLVKSR